MFKIKLHEDKLDLFLKPLNALTNIISDDHGGIVINLDKEKLEANIYAKNDSMATLAFIKYKSDMFTGAELDKDEKIGVLRLADFIKYFSVLDSKEIELFFDNNTFSLTADDSDISFRTADIDMIKEGPKNFKGASFIAEIEIDDNFNKIKKAMSALHEENCVFISGKSSENKIVFTVRDGTNELNKYKLKVTTTLSQDFEIVFSKEIFNIAISVPGDKKKLHISERFAMVVGETDLYTMTYFIARKVVK